MCIDHARKCSCGKNSASFNFRDEILPFDTVAELYCPTCSHDVPYDNTIMLSDNGWIIEYNMEAARFLLQKVSPASGVTPEFLFDEGYCTWRGVYPRDHIDSAKERNALLQLAKTDRKRYFEEFKTWGIKRMERLAQAGWRKANEREPAKA
jgi:hypothetical protein